MLKELRTINALLLSVGLTASFAASASLGGYPLTGAEAHVSATATLRPAITAMASSQTPQAAAQPYTVNIVTLDSGVTVREFVSTASNQVFAVVWNGPVMPDLRQILGTSFDTVVTPPSTPANPAIVSTHALSGRTVSANGVVVHTHGVPGNFSGSAYISADFPPGVTLKSLQQAQANQ